MALTPGTRLGPYVIAAPLGAGGMGDVYKATDTRLNRTVALKVVSDRIGTEGGSQPRWSPNGRELLYLRRDGTLMSVPIETAPSFVKRPEVPLFKTEVTTVDPYRLNFVPSKDGNRILMSAPMNSGDPPAITVVMNWPALLKK